MKTPEEVRAMIHAAELEDVGVIVARVDNLSPGMATKIEELLESEFQELIAAGVRVVVMDSKVQLDFVSAAALQSTKVGLGNRLGMLESAVDQFLEPAMTSSGEFVLAGDGDVAKAELLRLCRHCVESVHGRFLELYQELFGIVGKMTADLRRTELEVFAAPIEEGEVSMGELERAIETRQRNEDANARLEAGTIDVETWRTERAVIQAHFEAAELKLKALRLVAAAEADLGPLSRGQRVDLFLDNLPELKGVKEARDLDLELGQEAGSG